MITYIYFWIYKINIYKYIGLYAINAQREQLCGEQYIDDVYISITASGAIAPCGFNNNGKITIIPIY